MQISDVKGQGAMEYLMTYGWAILVVMIVGVMLWKMGVFGGNPEGINMANGFAKMKPFEPGIKYDTVNGLSFILSNGAGTFISDLNITAGGDCVGRLDPESATMDSGSAVKVSDANSICDTSKMVGDAFKVNLTITYTQMISGHSYNHTDRGRITGIVE